MDHGPCTTGEPMAVVLVCGERPPANMVRSEQRQRFNSDLVFPACGLI